MREIKFRGYSDGYNAWKYGFGVSIVELSESMQKNLGVKEIVYLHTDEGKVSVVAESVGQYTGLKRMNGVEIYDGDLVQGFNRLWEVVVVENVHYWNGCFMFGNYNAHEFLNKHQHIEVIGNVYENKELLEGK